MLGALRHRDFRLLWIGQAISLTGDGIYLVAIAWLVYDISNEPGALAIVGFAWTLPQVAGLLLAGVLSDRFERRRLLVIADLIRFVAIGAIAAAGVRARPRSCGPSCCWSSCTAWGRRCSSRRSRRSSPRSSRARSCCTRTRCAS